MDQIKPHAIWIGSAVDGHRFRDLFEVGVRAVVQLAYEEPPILLPRELMGYRFPILDGGGNDFAMLKLAITSVAGLVRNQVPTLVCCAAGMSRSPVIVAAALGQVFHQPIAESLRQVSEYRKGDVSAVLLREIMETHVGD